MNRIDQRIAEAAKLGFEKIIVSRYNQKEGGSKKNQKDRGIEVVTMARVEDVYRYLF